MGSKDIDESGNRLEVIEEFGNRWKILKNIEDKH